MTDNWNAQYTIGNTERHMHNDIAKILIQADDIQAKVREIGKQIAHDYAPLGDLLLVGVLKGCIMFMVDLARAIPMPVAIDFIAISSYGLDYGELYRNLPYIGVLKQEVYTREA